ncbi:MAG TPA: type II toxin-antitoxin system RelE/ParE family toxin [Thermodesulfovibrionia bacterium]|nr:type II toxin-antitoxin system RelE/ParE family toxin [Thermodesulfovibrionia bacterium]
MTPFKLSTEAEQDLRSIYLYTYRNFGEEQADKYLSGLENAFQMISSNPRIGRERPDIDPLVRCMEHGKHVIFYDLHEDHILIVRVLHGRMDVKKHL